MRELSALVTIVDLCAQQHLKRQHLEDELAKFPPDLDDLCAREEAEWDQLTALGQALSPLLRLQAEREAVRLAQRRAHETAAALRQARAAADRIEVEWTELVRAHDEAAMGRQTADEHALVLKSLRDQALLRSQEFDTLADSPLCLTCGQPLTPEHIQAEHTRREAEAAEAARQYLAAEQAADEAARGEHALRTRKIEAEDLLNRDRRQIERHERDLEDTRRDTQHHVTQCQAAYHELLEPFRSQVSPEPPEDWLTTTYPTAADVNAARREVEGLDSIRRRLQAARRDRAERDRLRDQRDMILQTLDEQRRGLPSHVPDLRLENERLTAEDALLKERLRARWRRGEGNPEGPGTAPQGSRRLAGGDRKSDLPTGNRGRPA